MRSFRIYLGIGILLLLLYVVAEYNKPAPLNWRPTLSYQDKIPFGAYITYNELHQIFPESKIVNTNENFYDLFHGKNVSASNYLIITNSVNFTKYDFSELKTYVKKGNSVFIAAKDFTGPMGSQETFTDSLHLNVSVLHTLDSIGLHFTNNNLKAHDYKFDRGIANYFFNQFDTTKAVVLSKNEYGNANLIRYQFGKGYLYLCANPGIFTNYGLLNNHGADYVAKTLSYLPVQSVIYWDHYQNGDIVEDTSPLRVFFSHPSLEWAYYISLFGMVIFILYEMKRRQRIIPVIEPLKNSTVQFVNVVGQVYYEQRNNMNIARKKILFFLEHIRTKYYLKTNTLDAEFAEKLSQKTGIEISFIKDVIGHMNYVNAQRQINDHELILLNQLIEQFYIKSR